MKPIRTLIVDDEPLARAGVRVLLEGDAEIEVIGECASGPDAVEMIASLAPDLLFLDVQMPEMDGFGVLREIAPDRMPVIVFATAYDRHAIQAFEAGAHDYLLKPFDEDRFALMLRRAKAQVRREQLGHAAQSLAVLSEVAGLGLPESASRTGYLTRFAVRSVGHTAFVRADEVEWIEAEDYCVRLHTGAKSYLIRESLSGLEPRLKPATFFRVHRSAVVNLDHIQEIRAETRGRFSVILRNGRRIPLSRGRREPLEAALDGRI